MGHPGLRRNRDLRSPAFQFLPPPSYLHHRGGGACLGSVGHIAHMVEANARFFTEGLVTTAARLLCHEDSSVRWSFDYIEANILGSVRYSEDIGGIKLVVAGFADLFGTDEGRKLQEWARSHGWPVAWAL